MNILDMMTAAIPSVVAVFYLMTSFCFVIKGDYAWAIVWGAYSVANFGLIIVGGRK